MLKAIYLTLLSAGIAVIFNSLFFEKVPGISVAIITVILLGTVHIFGLHQQVSLRKSWWLVALICFFALMPGIRANDFLTFLNICATFGLLMLVASELTGTPAPFMRLRDYLVLMTLIPLRMLGKAASTVTLLGQIRSQAQHRDVWLRVLKGTVLAVPVLIIFGVLFSQADLAFAQFIKRFIDIHISERTIQYLVLLLFAFVATLSFLSFIFFTKKGEPREPSAAVAQPGRSIEVMVFLGLIAALFLVFIGFQITYLFGGEANIVGAGFTYAEYARRGFFELLAVAALSLLVLLASEKYAGAETKRDRRFLIPALVLIAEVGVVIASAAKRLSLYIDAYSLTELRFYVAGFLVLLLALFTLLAVKFITSRREEFFVFGSLLAIATSLITVNLVNPDAFIARYNLEQHSRTDKIDVVYIGRLSADAEQQKIELYQKLAGPDKDVLRELLQKQKERLEKTNAHWQSANLSRTRALKVLQELEI